MRKIVGFIVCLSVLFCCTVSFAYTVEVKEHIPEEYLLVAVYGANPRKPIDTKYIKKIAAVMRFFNVYDLQIAVYDKGTRFGDGMRAVFNGGRGKEGVFKERARGKPLDEEWELGYSTKLDRIYEDRKFGNDIYEDFYKKNTVLFSVEVTEIEYSDSGIPSIKGELYDKSAEIHVRKEDPLLSQLKVGDTLRVRGQIIDFSSYNIVIEGMIRRLTRASADNTLLVEITP